MSRLVAIGHSERHMFFAAAAMHLVTIGLLARPDVRTTYGIHLTQPSVALPKSI